MKFIQLLLGLFIPFMLCISSCNKDTEESGIINQLEGTKWKLKGFVDSETGKITLPIWTECNECFTITFDTDSTATGKSYLNLMWVDLNKTPLLRIETMIWPEDETLLNSVVQTESYSITENELRFIYGNNYILYEIIK
ncbi:MAG: hypothetical protein LIP05_14320 [Tannerellaceae bacterium]|nr:hypothetical protein [Tannerellaceae bacterium]